ncbi:MAG: hypothetical protein HUU10_10360 [Bacteroidetes bacterium]|nr:hypothetical protein [Bacteroidota bacterium]
MKALFRSTAVLGLVAALVTIAGAQDLKKQWEVAKPTLENLGLPTDAMPTKSLALADSVDDDTFRELKATFEEDASIQALILVESKATWVMERKKNLWAPAIWFGAIAGPLVGLGVALDQPGATVGGLVAGTAAAAVSYFYFSDSKEIRDFSNTYSGKAAVFIIR